MSELKKSLFSIYSLEELAQKDTPVHRLHPTVKLLSTLIYIIAVISFGPEEFGGLMPFLLYPALFMALGQIPFRTLFGRLLLVLPFVVFAGLTNMLVSRELVYYLGSFAVTKGMLSFLSIILKTVLTVLAVLILIATTSTTDLLLVMVQLQLPSILVLQLTMMFRYLGVLLEEAQTMYHAYLLRAPGAKGIKLQDMGSFLGQLILRSFDRSERIYNAMKCRGFDGEIHFTKQGKIPVRGWTYLFILGGLLMLFRMYPISEMIGRFFLG